MKIRLSGYNHDSIVDGPGIRFTVFAQGCSHNCPDCHNPQTHDYNGGELFEIDEIIEIINSNPLLDGVTFSGGEPFDQPDAFLEFSKKLKDKYNIFCYTGYTFEHLLNSENLIVIKLLKNIDVLIDGLFIKEKRSLGLKFKGSSNQRTLNCKESVAHGKAIEKDI